MACRRFVQPNVSVKEFAEDELTPVAVWRHVDVGTRHEVFGPLHELFDHSVEVDSLRKTEWLAGADDRGLKPPVHDPHALADLLVVAVATDPGQVQAFSLKRMERTLQ